MGKKYFQIFGIQRTSTTYTTKIVTVNTENTYVLTNKKHMPVDIEVYSKTTLEKRLETARKNKHENLCEHILELINDVCKSKVKIYPLVVIKNPYSWYQSISWWTKNNNKNFDIKDWYGRFNRLYSEWKELLENPHSVFGKGMVVGYENLLRSPSDFLFTLRNDYGIKLKNGIIIPKHMASQKKDCDRDKFFSEKRKQFYLQKGDFGLSKKLIKQITELVNWDLMKFYGYESKGGV